MFRIAVFFLLCTGTFSLLQANVNEEGKKIDTIDVINDQTPKDAKDANLQAKPTKLHPKLNQEQINLLAEKVIKIHGVELDNTDDENLKHIEQLKKVVANVEQNLNEKLKLTQDYIKEKTDSRATPASEEKLPEKETDASDTVGDAGKDESVNSSIEEEVVEDASEKIVAETSKSDTTNDLPDVKIRDEGVNANEQENNDANVNIPNANTIIEEETVAETETDDSKLKTTEENLDTAEKDSAEGGNDVVGQKNVNEDVDQTDQVKSVEDNESDSVEDIRENETSEDTDDTVNINRDNDEQELSKLDEDTSSFGRQNETVGEVGTQDKVVEQNGIDKDTNKEESTEETESNTGSVTEDDTSEVCNLDTGCDQEDTRKTHLYSEENNSEDINEKEVEDSYLQTVTKYVTSFLN